MGDPDAAVKLSEILRDPYTEQIEIIYRNDTKENVIRCIFMVWHCSVLGTLRNEFFTVAAGLSIGGNLAKHK